MLEFRTVEAEQQSGPEIAYKVHTLALPTCKSGIIKVDVGSSDVLQYFTVYPVFGSHFRQWEFRFSRCLKLADAKWRLATD